MCACTGLLVQHSLNVCTYRTAGTTFTDCVHVQDCWYNIHWLCACTGLLVKHSLTVITTNSSLTHCTAGSDQMFTNVYAISWQHSSVHIVTHCAISKKHTYPTLCNTFFIKRQTFWYGQVHKHWSDCKSHRWHVACIRADCTFLRKLM